MRLLLSSLSCDITETQLHNTYNTYPPPLLPHLHLTPQACDITEAGARPLRDALLTNRSLLTLMLADNKFTAGQWEALSKNRAGKVEAQVRGQMGLPVGVGRGPRGMGKSRALGSRALDQAPALLQVPGSVWHCLFALKRKDPPAFGQNLHPIHLCLHHVTQVILEAAAAGAGGTGNSTGTSSSAAMLGGSTVRYSAASGMSTGSYLGSFMSNTGTMASETSFQLAFGSSGSYPLLSGSPIKAGSPTKAGGSPKVGAGSGVEGSPGSRVSATSSVGSSPSRLGAGSGAAGGAGPAKGGNKLPTLHEAVPVIEGTEKISGEKGKSGTSKAKQKG